MLQHRMLCQHVVTYTSRFDRGDGCRSELTATLGEHLTMNENANNSDSIDGLSPTGINRRDLLKGGLGLGAAAAFGGILAACGSDGDSASGSSTTAAPGASESTTSTSSGSSATGEPIKVGFLTDFSGATAALGAIQFNCFKLAVDQINASGGIAGREFTFVQEDDANDSTQVIEKATKLALEDEVTAVFGQITSLAREASLTVLPAEQVPLFYTTYYEGAAAGAVACDPFLIATGQVPNQQIAPLVPWLTENIGTKYTVIGSDYIWPRGTTEVLESLVADADGTVTSATYFPFGTTDFGPFFADLEDQAPDICWSTLAGSDFTTFMQQWDQFNPSSRLVSLAMDNVRAGTNPDLAVGTIASQSYFMEAPGAANEQFVSDYRAAYGDDGLINSIGEAAYNAAFLFKLAVEEADGSTDSDVWIPKLSEVNFESPSGSVRIDAATQHTVSTNFIGEKNANGGIDILDTRETITPIVAGCELAR